MTAYVFVSWTPHEKQSQPYWWKIIRILCISFMPLMKNSLSLTDERWFSKSKLPKDTSVHEVHTWSSVGLVIAWRPQTRHRSILGAAGHIILTPAN
jgi:hypothetical protein